MISVDHISKFFGKVRAVENISFEVKEQESLVLLGTSGCGKTTTLKMINHLVAPTSGKIIINGENIADLPAEILRRNIGYVLQHYGLFPHYSIRQNIAVVPTLLGWEKRKISERIEQLLFKLHLPETILSAYPRDLSGGQQQRVGLARALAANPPILLMDEPFGALDSITRNKIHREFMELDELKRKTIIMVTHDIQEAFELGDRICLMDQGKIIQNGSPADLIFSPKNDFVKEFLQQQRLQLELKAFNLSDIWTSLPAVAVGQSDIEKKAQLEANSRMTIWQVLEFLTSTGQQSMKVATPQGKEIRQADFSSIVKGFYQYRNTRSNG